MAGSGARRARLDSGRAARIGLRSRGAVPRTTGRAPTARRTSSSTTPPPPRTSRRRRSSPPCATLDRFDRRRPFGPWLHRIVVNRAIDWSRARDAARGGRASTDARGGASRAEPRRRGLLPALADALPEHRAVIVLRHLLEYTPGEIAELLDLPRGTVNSRLAPRMRRARRPARGGRPMRRWDDPAPGEREAGDRSWESCAQRTRGASAATEARLAERCCSIAATAALLAIVAAGAVTHPVEPFSGR